MEQVIVALVGLTLTVAGLTLAVMIHLDRSRRQETDKLRAAEPPCPRGSHNCAVRSTCCAAT